MPKKQLKSRGIWLVGATSHSIIGSKLPSKRQILSRFITLHQYGDKLTISSSAAKTANEVSLFWEKARIQTQGMDKIVNKIKNLFELWIKLKKNMKRRSECQIEKEKVFEENLENLFDVAHKDALNLTKKEEDREFLIAQREPGRRGCLGSVDKKLAKVEDNRCKRIELLQIRQNKIQEESALANQEIELEHSFSSIEDSCDLQKDPEFCVPKITKKRLDSTEPPKKRPKNIIDTRLAATLDRTKVSNRKATFILAATAQSLGQSVQDFAINEKSIRRSRKSCRKELAETIKSVFENDVPLVVHWDGKMLQDMTGNVKHERLAILVSGGGQTKLLGVPKIERSTGECQANAVLDALDEWDLRNDITFLCFGTTASNTGINKGACHLIETQLDRDIGNLACRHHMLELVVAKVFDTLFGPSSGPDIPIFKRFAESWKDINHTMYESGVEEIATASDRLEIINFVKNQLKLIQPRDDYKEMLHLVLLFLKDDCSEKISIRAPGPIHRARWMSRIIYSLKIYLFRSQFSLTSREISQLKRFNMFIVKCYVKFWYLCPISACAPKNDLDFLKCLNDYRKTDLVVSKAAIDTFSNHLWYLNEVLVGLSFFDPNISVETKALMSEALDEESDSESVKKLKFCPDLFERKIENFVTKNTRKFFDLLRVTETFSAKTPSSWQNDETYQRCLNIVKNLSVVNDVAERGVALASDFNNILVQDEEQKKYLMQVVEQHRKRFPLPRKKDLA